VVVVVVVVDWAMLMTEHDDKTRIKPLRAARGRNIKETLLLQVSSVGSAATVS